VITTALGEIEGCGELISVTAREWGRALIAAADEVEKMNGYDRTTVS
jgi:hypothetical protein